ncbi:MAG TPA: NHL repeat-containing protein, partial [Acidimicrobiales bacterium]|nr:NHL repeat-containing protein [Acidimicrobiales bacterium]
QLESPGGLALDTAGDLFVADTGHCRVLEVPAQSAFRYGRQLQAGRVVTVAGGSCTGAHAMGRPSGLAVDLHGDVYVAEATAQRVQEIRAGGTAGLFTVVGSGLDQPTSVAVDESGDVFIADTAHCRVVALPARDTMLFGQVVRAGQLSTVAGTGTCGTTGQGGPAHSAELWNPVGVALDPDGNLLVADSGDQSVLLIAVRSGTDFGTTVGAGDIAVVLGGTGSYGSYLADGLPAAGPTAELNDPRGLALAGTDLLFVTDGFMHALRVVPATTGTFFGRAMTVGDLYTAAGAVPVQSAAGGGDGTRWVLTHLGTPTGVAVSASGTVYVADAARDEVLALSGSSGGGGS